MMGDSVQQGYIEVHLINMEGMYLPLHEEVAALNDRESGKKSGRLVQSTHDGSLWLKMEGHKMTAMVNVNHITHALLTAIEQGEKE